MKARTSAGEHISHAKACWSAPISDNERAWIDFIRLASGDADPPPTLRRVRELRMLFSGPAHSRK